MSTLVFDGTAHTLTLYDSKNASVGHWHANNVVDHKATLRFVPNRDYRIIDQVCPHRHGGNEDTLDGAYGRFGILRLEPFLAAGHHHDGVGVHSGRANKGAADHATMGCIRTTDAAILAITQYIPSDPLTTITVQNNHDQVNNHVHRKGDSHHHAKTPAAKHAHAK